MNNDSPFTAIGDEPVEARIVAWVLGEASAFEAAELERLCEERPELLVFRRRMRALHGLLTEAEAAQPDEGWKLPAEKRKVLDEIFGEENTVRLEVEKETRIRHSGRRAFLAIAACLVLTLVVLRLIPWKQVTEAEVTLEVKPRAMGMRPLGPGIGDASAANPMTPQFFATEFEKIKSRNSLEKVVENLELTQRWGVDKETALKRLKETVKTENIRGTDLLSIKVQDADEQAAKEIAGEVAKNYTAYRSEIESRDSERAIQELNKAVRDQEDKVEERRKVLSTIVRTKGIIYKGADSSHGTDEDSGRKDQIREEAIKRGLDAQDYVDAKREFETDRELLQQMKLKMIGEDITRKMGSASVEVHDQPVIASRKVSALDAVTSGLGKLFSKQDAPASELAKLDRVPASRGMIVDRRESEATAANTPPPASAPAQVNAKKRDVSGSRLFAAADQTRESRVMADAAFKAEIPDSSTKPENIPGVDQFSSGGVRGGGSGGGFGAGLAMVPQAAESSQEENERSSRPRVVPNREAPVNGPAGADASDRRDRQLAQNAELRPNVSPAVPASPAAPPAPVTSPATAEPAPMEQSAKELAEAQPAKAEAPAVDAFAMKTDSDADPFADESVANSSFAERKPQTKAGTGTLSLAAGVGGAMPSDAAAESITNGLRSGDVAVTKNNIDAILNADGRIAGEKAAIAETKKAQDGAAPVAEDMPVLGNLFADKEKSEPGRNSDLGRNRELSGANTYTGGSAVTAGKLELGGRATDAPASSTATLSDVSKVTPSGDIVYTSPDDQASLEDSDKLIKRQRIAGPSGELQKTLSDASVAKAMQDRKVGKYREAREELKKVLEADPDNQQAKREIAYLDDPIRTNPALTQEGSQNVDKVRRGLYTAEGNYNLGKYDEAKHEYENALRTDPYNSAARRGLEKIASAKSDYYRAAYDHTRAELLSQVDASWELAVPADEKAKGIGDKNGFEGVVNYGSPIESGKPDSGISIVREFQYPTEAAPPVLPDLAASDAFSKTPATPEGWSESNEGERDAASNSDRARFAYYLQSTDSKANVPMAGGALGLDANAIDKQRRRDEQAAAEKAFAADSSASGFAGANVDLYYDTSKSAESDKRSGGVEYEIHTGYTSEYLFRGVDLGKAKPEPAPIPLVDLMEEIAATEDPYSTFSLNISDASFQVAQAALAKGERPDPAGIKVEQFYNAVDYGDPAPTANEPVAVNIEQAAHPVIPGRNLVRIALKTAAAGRSAAQPLRLTLLVDQSGSMVREDRRAAMDKALASLSGLLTDKDSVTVIGFSRTPRLLADGMAGDQAAKLNDLVNQSASEGGTNLEEALKLGEQMADRHKLAGAQNRIVLFTDGAANLGNADPVRLAEKVKQLRQKGVSFDIAGIAADGLNDELLGELARNGNGRYYVVGKGADDNIGKQLAGAFRPAAENVKVQVRFNPERVGRYKLIGFEKDRLKTEDFRNDKVDAAELAADEAGVAVYQVEPLPGGSGELGEVSVRFHDAASDHMVERTWTIPHDDKAPAFDRATPSMQLATLAMLAAEKLKGGPLGEAIDFKQLAEPRANVKRYYGSNSRVGEVLQMLDALK